MLTFILWLSFVLVCCCSVYYPGGVPLFLSYIVRTLREVNTNVNQVYFEQFWIAPVTLYGTSPTGVPDGPYHITSTDAVIMHRHLISYPLMAFMLEVLISVLNHRVKPGSNEFNSPNLAFPLTDRCIVDHISGVDRKVLYEYWANQWHDLRLLLGNSVVDAAWWHAKILLQRTSHWLYALNWMPGVSRGTETK